MSTTSNADIIPVRTRALLKAASILAIMASAFVLFTWPLFTGFDWKSTFYVLKVLAPIVAMNFAIVYAEKASKPNWYLPVIVVGGVGLVLLIVSSFVLFLAFMMEGIKDVQGGPVNKYFTCFGLLAILLFMIYIYFVVYSMYWEAWKLLKEVGKRERQQRDLERAKSIVARAGLRVTIGTDQKLPKNNNIENVD